MTRTGFGQLLNRSMPTAFRFARPALVALLLGATLAPLGRAQTDYSASAVNARQADSARKVAALLSDVTTIELIALDPALRRDEDDTGPRLLRWKILGNATLSDPKAIARLSTALTEGIRESKGMVAACFNPRHALRFEQGGKPVTMIICFECLQAHVEGAADLRGFLTTDRPNAVFDEVFSAAGIKKTK